MLDEPSVVAIRQDRVGSAAYAVGHEAKLMIGRIPQKYQCDSPNERFAHDFFRH